MLSVVFDGRRELLVVAPGEENMELQTLIDLFILDVCGGKTNQTGAAYRGKLRRLTAFFGVDRDVETITRNDLEKFKIDLQTRKTHMRGAREEKGGLSPFTVRTCLVTVRFLFSWAAGNRYLPYSPMEGVRVPTPPPPDPKPVSTETVVKLLEVAAANGQDWEKARNVAILYTLADTGGRAGGLVSATVSDLDLSRGWIMVTEKGQKARALFLTQTSIEALKTWLSWRNSLNVQSDRLFLSVRGTGLTYRGLSSLLRDLAKKANLKGERYNAHAFRHHFARECIQNGADLSQVAALMGHPDTRVTSAYYARWDTKEQKKAHSQFSPVHNLPEIQANFGGAA